LCEGRNERGSVSIPDLYRRLERCSWCGTPTGEGTYVVADLAERYKRQLAETVGPAGRMIALSKAGYREQHPDRVLVFNASLALRVGKLWHGDLDLSVDEPVLVELACRLGHTVYVLHERDARFEHERQPLLERAVYWVDSEGLCWFDRRRIERDRGGRLRERSVGG
jgi:hypothetical protein